METILTVLLTLVVVSLIGAVLGVMRLNRRVDDLEVARMDIDDDIIRLRQDLEDDIKHIHGEMGRDKDSNIRNLDRRLDKVWNDIKNIQESHTALAKTVLN